MVAAGRPAFKVARVGGVGGRGHNRFESSTLVVIATNNLKRKVVDYEMSDAVRDGRPTDRFKAFKVHATISDIQLSALGTAIDMYCLEAIPVLNH